MSNRNSSPVGNIHRSFVRKRTDGAFWPDGTPISRGNAFDWQTWPATIAPTLHNGQPQREIAAAKRLKTVQHWSIA